jgi:Protein of unknown function (DUF2490)
MKKYLFIFFGTLSFAVHAQNDRLNDFNNIYWLQSINTFNLNKKWSLHLEYQWRRENGLKDWQQSLLRVGANYKLNENITGHVGYGWVETFPYGDFPIASAGTFPEHRLYEQITFRLPVNKWTFSHRFRIEQRWLRKVKAGTSSNREIEDWTFLHRFRYQFRTQYPFWKKDNRQLYGAIADEIFIGAGKNLGINIFDQNRIFVLLGLRGNKNISLELGYLNQTLQQGRRINNKSIIQRNNGVVLTSVLSL